MKKIILSFVAAIMLFACAPKADNTKQPADEKKTNKKKDLSSIIYEETIIMPDFTLMDSNGNEVSLYETLDAGNTVIVDFWALWCVPCIKLLPHLSSFTEKYDNVKVFAISEDSKRQSAKAGKFVAERGWKVSTLYDQNGAVKKLLDVGVIPETFYVTPDRRIHFRHFGYKEGGEVELEHVLKELLESYDK